MKSYRVEIKGWGKGTADNVYNVQASNYGTALNRAVSLFKRDFPNRRWDWVTTKVFC